MLTPILPIWSPMPAKVETTPALPGLSPVGGKPVIARFDGGQLSSDGGLLVLREVEQRLGVAGVVQNPPILGYTDARKPPACLGRISIGRMSVAGGGQPPRVKRAGAEAVPGPTG